MEQVLINIIKNAIEAIDTKGFITVATNLPAMQLIITYTGPGITPENSDQLFSPFFSTKKDGQGVGLTFVKEILLNHQFEFTLKNTEQHTTAFTIRFS